jgi:3-phosphoshikimate 1-carboxyvinyltransferase
MKPILKSSISTNIKGTINAPSDKSLSHRAVIFSSLAAGESSIENLLCAEDIINNIKCFEKLGVSFSKKNNNTYIVKSPGAKKLKVMSDNLMYMGNSGTACRLLCGLFCGLENIENILIDGDSSLQKRPMDRIILPLEKMGALIQHNSGLLPIKISGRHLKGIEYKLPVASAQIKSSILLASLFSQGQTKIIEPQISRDHTENILKTLGFEIYINDIEQDKREIIFKNPTNKQVPTYNYKIPGDFSSAAFFIALGLITKNSEIKIQNVNLNPLRTGLLEALKLMNATIYVIPHKNTVMGEPIGDIVIKSSNLIGANIPSSLSAKMIDEFPILSVIASFAQGQTIFNGIEELKHKESNRLKAIYTNLNKIGINTLHTENSLTIYGNEEDKLGNIEIDSVFDHRIAMSFLILGSRCIKPITVSGCESINTSFPEFYDICKNLKLNIN